MQAYALVDYDNVKPITREAARFDVEFNVEQIAKLVTAIFRSNFPACREVFIRFYGGWTDKMNSHTSAGHWIHASTANIRGRRDGIRVLPEVASSNLFSEISQFVGLYRDGGQKMVDTLIVADLVTLAHCYSCPILLLSDDEDMLPGVVAARLAKRDVLLSRKRALGDAMNDGVLSQLRIRIEGCPI